MLFAATFPQTKSFLNHEIYDEVVGQIWEASDEEDLVEEITTAYGWCIKSLDYRHVLK
jgi:hypothetical protein